MRWTSARSVLSPSKRHGGSALLGPTGGLAFSPIPRTSLASRPERRVHSRANVLFPCALAALVALALACQQRQETRTGAPVDGDANVVVPSTARRPPGTPPTPAAAEIRPPWVSRSTRRIARHATVRMVEATAPRRRPSAAARELHGPNGVRRRPRGREEDHSQRHSRHAMIAWQGTLTEAEIEAVSRHEMAFSRVEQRHRLADVDRSDVGSLPRMPVGGSVYMPFRFDQGSLDRDRRLRSWLIPPPHSTRCPRPDRRRPDLSKQYRQNGASSRPWRSDLQREPRHVRGHHR